ncbi:MAG: toluene tolerance protein [Rhodospirillales bacterium]|nr:toluene tolerance protein [Rhodospirillales bacterium]
MMGRRSLGARALRILVAVAIVFGMMSGGPAHAAATPAGTVESFHEALLGVMKDAGTLGVKGRYERLASQVDATFDLPGMLRIATGPAWAKATADQQAALLNAFRRMTVGTFASRFDGYSGQSFLTASEKQGPQKTTLVNAQIVRPGKTPVALTYVMIAKDDAWRAIDIILDTGISELATRKSEYSRILETDGIDGLVKALNAKSDELVNS